MQKYYQKIIYYGLLFLTVLLVLLGWSTKYLWGMTLWGGIVLSLFLLDIIFSKKIHPPKNINISLPLFLFMALILIGSFFSIYFYNSLVGLLKIILAIITFFLVIKYLPGIKQIKTLVLIFLTSGFIIALYGLVNFFQLENVYGIGVASNFGWRNTYAGFLLLILPLAITLYFTSVKKWATAVLAFISIVVITNLYFTFSQASWLALIFSSIILLYFLITNIKLKQILKRGLIIISGSILLIWFLIYLHGILILPLPINQVQEASTLAELSIFNRLDYWWGGWEIFKTSPFLGVGLGNFGTLYTHYQKNIWSFSNSPHNFFILLAAETGILGLLLFLWFLYALLKPIITYVWGKRKKLFDQENINNQSSQIIKKEVIILGLSASLLASFIHAMLDFDWEIPGLFLLWLILAGITYNLTNQQNTAISITSNKSSAKQQILQMILLLFIGYFLIALPLSDSYRKIAENNMRISGKAYQTMVYYKKALRLIPFNAELHNGTSKAYWNLILEHIGLRERNQYYLLKHAKKAVSLHPESSYSHYLLGWAYIYASTKNNPLKDKGIESFKQAILFNPFNKPGYYLTLAQVYLEKDDKEKAKNVLERALTNFKEEDVQKIFLDRQKSDEMKEILKNIQNLYIKLEGA